MRHGQIKNANEKRFIGLTDAPLDETGTGQACYWQAVFSDFPLDAIYSSHLERCEQTARQIAGKKPVINTNVLNEIDMGEWDGKAFEEIKTRYPEEFKNRGETPSTYRPPGGESFQDISDRVLPFFNELFTLKNRKTLVVTHAGVIRVVLCHIHNIALKDLFRIKPGYAELFVLG